MRYAVINEGVVVNHALADAEFAATQGWVAAENSEIGDLWDGAAFTAPPAPPEPVPASCTRRQGRLALLGAGLLDDAEAAIAGIADPVQRRAAQIEYEADTWERANPFLQALWAGLGGTPEELDALFTQAVTL